RSGLSVLLLEARDRLGGRTWFADFPEAGRSVELGGGWVSRRHQLWVARELERYGVAVASHAGAGTFRWRLDGSWAAALALRAAGLYELERALYEIVGAARRIDTNAPRDEQDLGELDVSVEAFVHGLRLSTRPAAFLRAFATLGLGAVPSEWSALTALSWIAAFDNSAYSWLAAVSETLPSGTSSLLDAILADGGPEIRLQSPVVRVEQRPDEIRVVTAAGNALSAQVVVLAVPLNVLRDIAFEPDLSGERLDAAQSRHPGRMRKLWLLVDEAPADLVAVGWETELL